tara:strand:- start:245 stop:754 length:510 start_codon:yes stop_codon:yes gene_type:complete
MDTATMSNSANSLYDKWVLYAHLPHDTDWSIKSYKKIMTVTTIQEMIALYTALPEELVKNCMLFIMREGITPRWEDEKNRDGGCFSFKVPNKLVSVVWKNMSYSLVGETLSSQSRYRKIINGITISPKRAFCIIKIWMSDCSCQTTSILTNIPGLTKQGCIFKKHNPEY